MTGEALGIFAVVIGAMAGAAAVLPQLCSKVSRVALLQGFVPTVAFMAAGIIGHDTGLVSASAYTSLWAIGLVALLVVPPITVALAWKNRAK